MRSGARNTMSLFVTPLRVRSAAISPRVDASWKPCPEKAAPTMKAPLWFVAPRRPCRRRSPARPRASPPGSVRAGRCRTRVGRTTARRPCRRSSGSRESMGNGASTARSEDDAVVASPGAFDALYWPTLARSPGPAGLHVGGLGRSGGASVLHRAPRVRRARGRGGVRRSRNGDRVGNRHGADH